MTYLMKLNEEREEGRQEGLKSERLSSLRKVMAKLGYSAEQAMDFLDVPQAERQSYLALLP